MGLLGYQTTKEEKKMIKLSILAFVLLSTGCASTNFQDFSKAPQVNMSGMTDRIAAGAICHHYADTNAFSRNLKKIELIADKEKQQKEIRYLQLELYGECVVNIQSVLNDYKH
ncbi:MAG: hypothetical protein ACI9N9_001182, partial [Enterobacterales bacterium]